jgi:hypothetical protein
MQVVRPEHFSVHREPDTHHWSVMTLAGFRTLSGTMTRSRKFYELAVILEGLEEIDRVVAGISHRSGHEKASQ